MEDAVVRSGRREALFTLGLWLAAATYTAGYAALHAYDRAPQSIGFVLWFPDWMFWGVVAPWLCCATVSCLFALFFMQDESLVSENDAPADDPAAEAPVADDPARENLAARDLPQRGRARSGDRP